jgi:hypothetical protein
VNVSHGIPRDALDGSGTRVHVAVGAVVFVVLVEPAAYTGRAYPTTFPSLSAKSSSPSVLRPIPVCRSLYPATLSLIVAAFRANRAGRLI